MNDQTDDKEWCEAFAQQLIGVEETLEGSRRQLALAVREGRHRRLGKTEAEFRRDLGVQVMRDREKRQAFTKTLTEEGFTQRDYVAEGVDQKTVSDDLRTEENSSKNGQSAQESELALEENSSKPDEAAPAEEPLTVGQVKAVQAMIEALKRRVQKQEARHGGKSITGEFMLDDLLLLGRWVEKCQPPFSAVLAPVLGADRCRPLGQMDERRAFLRLDARVHSVGRMDRHAGIQGIRCTSARFGFQLPAGRQGSRCASVRFGFQAALFLTDYRLNYCSNNKK